MRKTYLSDISRAQYALIEPILLAATKVTHPSTYELYDVLCAVLYREREACRWRSLPHDFPKWENVYYHYNIWRERGVIDQILETLVGWERQKEGRFELTTMIIVDSKSVKNADTAEEKGYDAGKKRKV